MAAILKERNVLYENTAHLDEQTSLADEQSLNGRGEVLTEIVDAHVVVIAQRIMHHLTCVGVGHLQLCLQLLYTHTSHPRTTTDSNFIYYF